MESLKTCDVSLIICVYTQARWHDLLACVESVCQQTLPPKEIIVVVDHNPALLDAVRAQLPMVRAVENRSTRGLSGARNTGVEIATGEIIAFIDEDALAARDWLAQLSAFYADPSVLGVGGAIIPMWQTHKPRWFPEEFLWVVGCTYRGMPTATAQVRNLIGCNMSFRREAFFATRGFRSELGRIGTLPAGCEETEFCIRARQTLPQHILLYEPTAMVYHRVPAHRTTLRYFLSRCFAEGRSKALVARLVGTQRALESERAFVVRTLGVAIFATFTRFIARRSLGSLQRALAIVAGLLSTTAGYMTGSWTGKGIRPNFATS